MVTTKDGTKHKVLLNLNMRGHEDGICKVFDYTSDPDYGKLYQTLAQLPVGDKQLKPSESRDNIWEGNLMWINSWLNPSICVPNLTSSVNLC